MKPLWVYLIVIAVTLTALTAIVANCGYDACQVGASEYDSVSNQPSSDDGKLAPSSHHGCLCSHAVSVPDYMAAHVFSAARQSFPSASDQLLPEHNPDPLLKPPSRA